MRAMFLAAVAAAAMLAGAGRAAAGELDGEFAPATKPAAKPTAAASAKATELDAESPTQACRWRCGWGCGWRGYGWAPAVYGWGGGFSYYRSFGYGAYCGFRNVYPAFGFYHAPVYYHYYGW